MSAKTDLFKIDFEIGHLDGFSLADLSIFADNILFTTKNSSKDKLMIFITLTDLLFAWSEMILEKNKEYNLLSVASSFFIKFKRKNNKLIINDKNKQVQVDFFYFTFIFYDEMNRIYQMIKNIAVDNSLEDFKNEFKKFDKVYIDNIRSLL